MQIPIPTLNEIISKITFLKDMAEKISNNYNYRPAFHEQDDISFYNNCASIFLSASELHYIKTQFYLQLKEINVVDTIERIIKNIPDFHDENMDGTGATMIYTISNFNNYFCANQNTTCFIQDCDEVLNKIINLNST